ncbi:MAG: C40 family peptidase [Acidothermus sp.]|nr:C40 family peptidase [Acidothermus sp.]
MSDESALRWWTTSRAWRGLTAAVCAAAALVGAWPSSASAAKPETTAAIEKAQQQLEALNVAADQAVEAYDQAQIALASASARLRAQQAAVARAEARLASARDRLRGFAALQYESGGTTPLVAFLVSGDPQVAFRRADLLAQVNRYHQADLLAVIAATRQATQASRSAKQALAAQQAALTAVAAKKAAAEKLISKQQALLASLQTRARQEDAAARAAAARAAAARAAALAAARQAAQERASRSRTLAGSSGASVGADTTAQIAVSPPRVSGSGGAAAAVAFAYAQLGKPYVFGGAGPYGYDCSGLTMRAWEAGGVQLSHSSSAQQHEGRPVPLSALQPGDLVFWGDPAWHVAIYIGGGRVISAPHTGTVVQIQTIWGHPSGAVRP